VAVTADVGVSASGVGVSYATFYPYRDTYRDAVTLRGTPGEPAAITIRAYNSSGRLVRSWSVARRSTPWAIAWNGRTASGSLLAAGRYRVVQTVRDVLGHAMAYTAYTNLSNRRLRWYAGSITRYADTGSFSASAGGHARRSTTYARGVVLRGGALGVHRFTLPAAVSYSSIRFSVLGKSYAGWGKGAMGIEHYPTGVLHAVRTVGYSWTYHTTSAIGAAGHVSAARVVRGVVRAVGANEGFMVYQKVRITFRYSLLR
jgi:hypothetical protein